MNKRKRRGKYEPVIGVAFGGVVTYYSDINSLRLRERGEQLYRECTLGEAYEVLTTDDK